MIPVRDVNIEQVYMFKYVESVLIGNGKIDSEIRTPTGLEREAFQRLS